MQLLTPVQTASLYDWFKPDRPGPLVGLHVIQTGHGACFADRWPDPRALFIATADNGSLIGAPDVSFLREARPYLAGNFVDAPDDWYDALKEAIPNLQSWDRVIYSPPASPRQFHTPPSHADEFSVRRLTVSDAYALWGLSPDVSWVAKTWGGPAGLAASGMAWGAFHGHQIVAVACTFFVGDRYEEIGVATEPAFRGHGLSTACTAALCHDILARGRAPSWTTSPDNQASRRVAEKLGFTLARADRLFPIDLAVPATE